MVNFLEFNTKERVLKKAWEKKILMEGRRLSLDHDYATEVVLKDKAYVGIKRVLKEKKVIKNRILSLSLTLLFQSKMEKCIIACWLFCHIIFIVRLLCWKGFYVRVTRKGFFASLNKNNPESLSLECCDNGPISSGNLFKCIK